ncbi:MAG: diacylglycerol/lipid kinase family protein [Bacilli bacterium]
MKYVFVINPSAGNGLKNKELEELLKKYDNKIDYIIHKTTMEKEATSFVSSYLKEHNEETVIVACGGDGSLNEVVNGIYGYKNALLAIYPSGSGNDFIKYFGSKDNFLNLDKLFSAKVKEVDCLVVNNKKENKYCINVCHFGFDSYVAETANEVKKKGGKNPYGKGVRKALFFGRKNQITVKADNKVLNPKGKMLLCTLANGKYVGGKYQCAPLSEIDDGLIEVGFVHPCSIITIAKLMSKYEKGEHIGNPKFKKILKYLEAKEVEIYSPNEFAISIDGEIIRNDYFKINIEHKAIKLLVPQE